MTRARSTPQRTSDRGIATMLSLLIESRCGSASEIDAYTWELMSRAVLGAKQGDG